MTTSHAADLRSPSRRARGGASPDGAGAAGDWPRTTRVLPWMIAGFLVMVWLVPVEFTSLPVHLPFDSKIDRFALAVLAGTWLISLGTGSLGPRWRSSPVNVAVLALVVIAIASVAINVTALARVEELELGLKKLSLLLCYAALFVIVATSVRRREIRSYLKLMIGLACITALGTVIEYRTHVNYFFELANHLPFLSVEAPPAGPKYGRATIAGPTQHGLADATILGMVIPFVVVFMLQATERKRKIAYGVLIAILFAGGVATLRKTAIVLPVTGFLVVMAYRPLALRRLLPLGVGLLLFAHFISPGALGSIHYQLEGGDKRSNEGRTADYAAVVPDIETHPWLGRGFGTYDPLIHNLKAHPGERHRFLDNMVLHLLLEIGMLGVIAYLMIAVVAAKGLHRLARLRETRKSGLAVALIGAVVVCMVANVLFDALSFVQVPYLYFFLLAFAVIVVASERAQGMAGAGSAAKQRGSNEPLPRLAGL